METKNENGVTRHFDWEVEKAFKQERYGVPIADFFRYEAKAYKYGIIGYLGVLKEELKYCEEEFWEVNEIHGCDCMEILRKAILDLQELNIQPTTKQLQTTLTDIQRGKLFDLLLSSKFIAPSTNKESFIWVFGGKEEPTNWQPIEWIDKSPTRHEPNSKTLFELLYLLGVDKDTSANNPNNLYRKMEFCFIGIDNIQSKNTYSIQGKTKRQLQLNTILEEVEKVRAQK